MQQSDPFSFLVRVPMQTVGVQGGRLFSSPKLGGCRTCSRQPHAAVIATTVVIFLTPGMRRPDGWSMSNSSIEGRMIHFVGLSVCQEKNHGKTSSYRQPRNISHIFDTRQAGWVQEIGDTGVRHTQPWKTQRPNDPVAGQEKEEQGCQVKYGGRTCAEP